GSADDDNPGSSSPDGQQATVQGIRDLIDFFPLYLDINELLKLLPPSEEIQYTLIHNAENLRFVYTDLKPGTAQDYLTKLNGEELNNSRTLSDAQTIRVTNRGVALDPGWLNNLKNKGNGIL